MRRGRVIVLRAGCQLTIELPGCSVEVNAWPAGATGGDPAEVARVDVIPDGTRFAGEPGAEAVLVTRPARDAWAATGYGVRVRRFEVAHVDMVEPSTGELAQRGERHQPSAVAVAGWGGDDGAR